MKVKKAKVLNVGYNVGGERVGIQQIVTYAGQTIKTYLLRGKVVSEKVFMATLDECAAKATEQYELDPSCQ